ncbi:MAG: maleylpyruvate isomerase family mycothiol-dependent enzyme, partial [Propionicimonas sp.]|nr:maleylpyruvate isomerase family mycothiol-dependent enzyme [Propionicimonas sp.]
MRIAATQRAALVDALREADPHAPTLCEGWTVHDLAAHVWLREHEPASLAGSLLPALAGRTTERMEQVKAERPFGDLVDAF